jgi:DNA-directed RNA polymerase subunit RPC12/RpoP
MLYTAEATATGGREGHAHTSDGRLDVDLDVPGEMRGTGGTGTNPEQLFAAGDAACFRRRRKPRPPGSLTTMSPPRRKSQGPHKLLAVCPSCSSKLVYPTDLAGWNGEIVVSRRCPECEHRDVVVTARLPASLWLERNARQRDELAALCDAIADGLPLDLDRASRSPAHQDEPRAAEPDHAPRLPGSACRPSPRRPSQ